MLLCSIIKCYSVIEKADNKRVFGVINEANRIVSILNKSLKKQRNELIMHRKEVLFASLSVLIVFKTTVFVCEINGNQYVPL